MNSLVKPEICNRIWNSTKNFFIFPSKKVLKYSKVFSNFFMRKYFELFRLGSQTYCKIRVKKIFFTLLAGVVVFLFLLECFSNIKNTAYFKECYSNKYFVKTVMPADKLVKKIDLKFDQFKKIHSFSTVDISFSMQAYGIKEWDNIFQTAPYDSGIRLELAKDKNIGLVIGCKGGELNFKGFPISKIEINKVYKFDISISQNKHIKVFVDGVKLVDTIDPQIDYSISEIAAGSAFDGARPFYGKIDNFNISYKVFKEASFAYLLFKMFMQMIGIIIVFFLLLKYLDKIVQIIEKNKGKTVLLLFLVLIFGFINRNLFLMETVYSNTFKQPFINTLKSQPVMFFEHKFNDMAKIYDKSVEISFVMNIKSIKDWDNVFQTAAGNSGIRLEISKNNNFGLVTGSKDTQGFLSFPIAYTTELNKEYFVKIKICADNRIIIHLNNKKVVDYIDDKIDYQISDICVGSGFSQLRPFSGIVKNFVVSYALQQKSEMFMIYKILFIIVLLAALWLAFRLVLNENSKIYLAQIIKNVKGFRIKSFKIYPFVISVFPVIFILSNNINYVAGKDFFISLLAILGIAAVMQFSLNTIFNFSPAKAGIAVSVILLWFFSSGHIYSFISNIFPVISPFIFISLMCIVLALLLYIILRLKDELTKLESFFKVMAFVLILLPLLKLSYHYFVNIINNKEQNVEIGKQNNLSSEKHFPDIYYIILDNYANSNTLKTLMNYDNSNFIDYLEKSGFKVALKSASNYPCTRLSLPSSLNMDYLNLTDISNLSDLYINNKVLMFLKSKGYRFVNCNTSKSLFYPNKNADKDIVASSWSDYYTVLFQSTILFNLNYSDTKRNEYLTAFQSADEIIKGPSPKYVFMHIMSPHYPYVFGKNGERVDPSMHHDIKKGKITYLNTQSYLNELTFTNKNVKRLINTILSASCYNVNKPVIIIQSDHGPTMSDQDEIFQPGIDEEKAHMRILNAYYFPNGGSKVVYDTITPVNSFRLLFNYYFNENYPLLQDKNYSLETVNDPGEDSSLKLIEVTEKIKYTQENW